MIRLRGKQIRHYISLSAALTGFAVFFLVSTALAVTVLTNDDDFYIGSTEVDDVEARAGDDHLEGRDGGDTLRGQEDRDEIQGENGPDTILGAAGADDLRAGQGVNEVRGGVGQDEITGSSSNSDNSLYGDEDDDVIDARNNNVDLIKGGGGEDTCFVDNQIEKGDAENNSCEHVTVG